METAFPCQFLLMIVGFEKNEKQKQEKKNNNKKKIGDKIDAKFVCGTHVPSRLL